MLITVPCFAHEYFLWSWLTASPNTSPNLSLSLVGRENGMQTKIHLKISVYLICINIRESDIALDNLNYARTDDLNYQNFLLKWIFFHRRRLGKACAKYFSA